jgi:hypothetical protein
MGEVNRLFPAADDGRLVEHDARRGDRHLRRKQQVASAHTARAEHVCAGHRPPFVPEEHGDERDDDRNDPDDPQRRIAGVHMYFIHRPDSSD